MMNVEYPYDVDVPNRELRLWSGNLQVRQQGVLLSGNGSIYVRWLPSPTIRFRLEVAKDSPETLQVGESATLEWAAHSTDVLVLAQRVENFERAIVSGVITRNVLLGDSVSGEFLFGVVNLPPWFVRPAIVKLSLPDWEIGLLPCGDPRARRNALSDEGGYIVTHTGKASTKSSSPPTYEDVNKLMEVLLYLFSFARGSWTCPYLPVGFSSDGSRAWEEWGIRYLDEWSTAPYWFPIWYPQSLGEVLPGLHQRWTDVVWSEAVEIAIQLYVEANTHVESETSIIIAQAALEILAWVYFVEDLTTRTMKASEFRGLPASMKIEQLLRYLMIPTDIPSQMSALGSAEGVTSKPWTTGPEAITWIRNSLGHGQRRKKLLQLASQARWEARTLTIWYLELAMLRLFGYHGRYRNRVRNGAEDIVPWLP